MCPRRRPALPIAHTQEGIGRMQTDYPGSDAEVEIDQWTDPAIRAEPDWTMDQDTAGFPLRCGKEWVGLVWVLGFLYFFSSFLSPFPFLFLFLFKLNYLNSNSNLNSNPMHSTK